MRRLRRHPNRAPVALRPRSVEEVVAVAVAVAVAEEAVVEEEAVAVVVQVSLPPSQFLDRYLRCFGPWLAARWRQQILCLGIAPGCR